MANNNAFPIDKETTLKRDIFKPSSLCFGCIYIEHEDGRVICACELPCIVKEILDTFSYDYYDDEDKITGG